MRILIYLAAIIVANLITGHFGSSVSPYVAFIFIGLDMFVRDYLHDKWHGDKLWLKMLSLIFVGSLFSASIGVGRIAVASFLAFLLSGVADAIIYRLLDNKDKGTKIVASNFVSALVDSSVFLGVAFGFMPQMILIQWATKVLGGYAWYAAIKRYTE